MLDISDSEPAGDHLHDSVGDQLKNENENENEMAEVENLGSLFWGSADSRLA